MKSKLEALLSFQLKALGFKPEREYKFDKKRRWRFDFAFPNKKIGIECEGAVFSGGRHTRGTGFTKDCEKYNMAVELGWKVLRYTGKMINSGEAFCQIRRIIEVEEVKWVD